ncbi:MAG: hypothetical protein HOH19_05285 [Kordiimonadaceae bacterium]|jgi:hypothetical protein|nr:hypothetical protein [Kordiimonadaceae bacterium]
MDRRSFIASVGGAAALASMDANQKADALEFAMCEELEAAQGGGAQSSAEPEVKPNGYVATARVFRTFGIEPNKEGRKKPDQFFHMGHDNRLPRMSNKPSLLEFFDKRIGHSSHLLQSARLAKINGLPEKVVFACLLHDISVSGFISGDHGYYGSQLVAPYVDEEVSWAIKYHQSLRFIPDEEVGYPYPEAYIRYFGEDFKPEPYIFKDAEYARNHKWYMTARQICINDVYSFDPNVKVSMDDYVDIIGRNFKEPEEGLGYDDSPSSHMWRTMIFPNNFL